MRKVLFVLLLICALSLGVVGAQDAEPIRIGILTDLSGWLSIYGVEQINGFQLGLVYAAGLDPANYETIEDAMADVTVAGRPIELVIQDYGSENPAADADNAVAGARELVESEFVDIVVGTPNSGAAVAVQALMGPDNYDTIFMAGPAAAPTLTGETFNLNTFRVCRNTDQDALAFATIADQFGTNYVILAVDTAFGRGTAAAFETALGARGITFVAPTIYAPSETTDFTPYLQQVLDSGADTLIQIWAGAGAVALTQQTVELGVAERMNVVGGTNSNDIVAAVPPLEGSVAYIVYNYTLPDTEINTWMTDAHLKFFTNPVTGAPDVPDLFTECSFASAQALYLGLEATEGDPLPESMIPALEGLTWEGPKGTYFIRPGDHQTLAPLYIIRFLGVGEDGLPQYELIAEVSAEEAAPPCRLVDPFAERCEMNEMGGE